MNRSCSSRAARKRPNDLSTSSDAQLLAMLLARSRSSRAASVLEAAGGLGGVAQLGPRALAEHCGLTPAEALRVNLAVELGRRALLARLEERPALGSFDAVVDWARPRLAGLDHEEVWVVSLDGRNAVVAARRVAQGGLHGCALSVSDVLRPALRDGASAVVLVHNHPSGEPGASPEDVAMTRSMAAACDIVGVPLLDHVIVARGGACSLLELGALGVARSAA